MEQPDTRNNIFNVVNGKKGTYFLIYSLVELIGQTINASFFQKNIYFVKFWNLGLHWGSVEEGQLCWDFFTFFLQFMKHK